MFDTPLTIAFHIFSFIATLTTAYLIVVIWRASPLSLGKFKVAMVKLGVTDLLFCFFLEWLFIPDLIVPLPGAEVRGLMKYFGMTGAKIVFVLTLTLGGTTILSVNDCCIYRMFVFKKMDGILRNYLTTMFIIFFSSTLVIGGFFTFHTFSHALSYDELKAYAQKHNLTEPAFPNTTSFIAFDLGHPVVILSGTGEVLWLLGCEGCNVSFSYIVHRHIRAAQASLSTETLKMQQSLTRVLLLQAVIPFFAIFLPVITLIIGLNLNISFIQSKPMLIIFSMCVAVYPFVNSLVCIYFMAPYRKFTKDLFLKVFFCYKPPQTSSHVSEINPSSAYS